jgi:DNA-binding MarR family transcriptional regulator
MDRKLKEQLVQALLRFRKIGMTFPLRLDIRLGELFVLNGVAKHSCSQDQNVNIAEIQSSLFITKPAVSQILNSLESKGYVVRNIGRYDRRKIEVTLTPKGKDILEQAKDFMGETLETIISRFGEENTKQMTELFSNFADVFEEMKRESLLSKEEGETQH